MGVKRQPLLSHGSRVLTFIVVMLVASMIALANLSSEPVSADHFKDLDTLTLSVERERAHGWPLVW